MSQNLLYEQWCRPQPLNICGWGSPGPLPRHIMTTPPSFSCDSKIVLPRTVFGEKGPSVGGLLPKMVQALATKHWWLEKPRALPRHVWIYEQFFDQRFLLELMRSVCFASVTHQEKWCRLWPPNTGGWGSLGHCPATYESMGISFGNGPNQLKGWRYKHEDVKEDGTSMKTQRKSIHSGTTCGSRCTD